jgi:hypothetical protein
MNAYPLMNTMMLVAAAVVVWALFVWGRPLLARDRFRAEMSELRDRLVDAQLDGRLPDDSGVNDMVHQLELMRNNPSRVTLSTAMAIDDVIHRLGRPDRDPDPFCGYPPKQRQIMQQAQQELVRSMTRLMKSGSVLWLPVALVTPLFRAVHRIRRHRGREMPRPIQPPSKLAEQYTRASEGHPKLLGAS